MRTLAIIACILFSTFGLSAKEDYGASWQKANTFYEQKNYDSAVAYYEKIAALHPQDAIVYYNLGNAYYRLNDITYAVINYEKALQIEPNNKQAQDNLSIAQSRITNRIPTAPDIFFVKWWKALTASSNASILAIISLLLFISLIAYGILKKLKINIPDLPVQLRAGAWVLFGICILLSFTAAYNVTNRNKAVVTENDAAFYTSPQQTKPAIFLPGGTTVQCNGSQQNWTEVTLPDGRSGWIHTNTITKI